MVPGNRVLLRGPNSPMMVAAYFAVIKAGGIVVATMPLLRAKEIAFPLSKAEIRLALCDVRLADEMEKASRSRPLSSAIVYWGSGAADSLEAMMNEAGYERFAACDTASDDVCLIAFTSGTTGEPKGTMHFHRDMLAICDSFGKYVLRARPTIASSARRRSLSRSASAAWCCFRCASAPRPSCWRRPRRTIFCRRSRNSAATICFTAPTAYRAMLGKLAGYDLPRCANASRRAKRLPKATFEAWPAATGIRIIDGIGATEMLHIFIGSPEDDMRPGATGKPVPGYEARVVDEDGKEVPPGTPGGWLSSGPTGCRYLADTRQAQYVQNGWNVTGDTYVKAARRLFRVSGPLRRHDHFRGLQHCRAGSGNGAATHPAVAECGVVGHPTRNGDRSSRPTWSSRTDLPETPHSPARCRSMSKLRSHLTNIRARSNTWPACPAPRPANCGVSNCGESRRKRPPSL